MSGQFTVVPTTAIYDKRLNNAQYRTLSAISQNTDEDGITFFKISNLAKKLEIEKRTLQRNIELLKECGYISVKEMFTSNGRQSFNLYKVLNDKADSSINWEEKALKYLGLLGTDLAGGEGDKNVTPRDDTQSHGEGDTGSHPLYIDNQPFNNHKEKKELTLKDFLGEVKNVFSVGELDEYSLTIEQMEKQAKQAYRYWDDYPDSTHANLLMNV